MNCSLDDNGEGGESEGGRGDISSTDECKLTAHAPFNKTTRLCFKRACIYVCSFDLEPRGKCDYKGS